LILILLAVGSARSLSAQNVSLSIDASVNGGNPPVAGTTTTYTLTVSNEGPADALNVQLSTAVPAGTTFQSLASPGSWSCSGTSSISCSNPSFPPSSDVFTLVVNVPRATPQGTPITLDATVSTTSNDSNPNDNSVELVASVIWQSLLSLGKSAPPTAFAGGPITYTLTVTNAGPSDAADVVLNDALPATFVIDSITAPGWSCGGTVSCTMAQLGASSTVTIQGHMPASTPAQTIVNDADVSASTDTGTRTASASTILTISADLSITKSGSAPVPGNDVTYTIVVTNAGPSDASNVVLNDALPAPLTFQSITAPGWSCVASNCTRATLAPGTSTITLVAHVPPSTPPNTVITNTATVSSATSDPTTPNSASATGTTPLPPGAIPAMSPVALIALGLLLAVLALRRV
jgi:uncharacterized repeat protein (TIGR01451 family)